MDFAQRPLGRADRGRGYRGAAPAPVTAAPSSSSASRLAGLQDGFSQVAAEVCPAVVNINTEQHIKQFGGFSWDPFSEEMPRPRIISVPASSLGSGLLISSDGYILTNQHVINGAETIKVTLSDNRTLPARVIPGVPELTRRDLAIIKIEGHGFPKVRFGDANQVKVGAWAIAIGSPYGLNETVTVGVVSAKGRVLPEEGGQFRDLIQTDASINRGNSGVPLVNLNGEVIGVNQAIYSENGGSVGLGFAVPLNDETKDAIQRTMEGGREA